VTLAPPPHVVLREEVSVRLAVSLRLYFGFVVRGPSFAAPWSAAGGVAAEPLRTVSRGLQPPLGRGGLFVCPEAASGQLREVGRPRPGSRRGSERSEPGFVCRFPLGDESLEARRRAKFSVFVAQRFDCASCAATPRHSEVLNQRRSDKVPALRSVRTLKIGGGLDSGSTANSDPTHPWAAGASPAAQAQGRNRSRVDARPFTKDPTSAFH